MSKVSSHLKTYSRSTDLGCLDSLLSVEDRSYPPDPVAALHRPPFDATDVGFLRI